MVSNPGTKSEHVHYCPRSMKIKIFWHHNYSTSLFAEATNIQTWTSAETPTWISQTAASWGWKTLMTRFQDQNWIVLRSMTYVSQVTEYHLIMVLVTRVDKRSQILTLLISLKRSQPNFPCQTPGISILWVNDPVLNWCCYIGLMPICPFSKPTNQPWPYEL